MASSSFATFATFVLLLAVHESVQKSSPNSPTYRAAVVEFYPVLYENDSARTLKENAMKMKNYIELAAEKKVDILVFPELIPTTFVHPPREDLRPWTTEIPAPSQNYSLCESNDTSISDDLKELSCAANINEIYVAINTVERKNCVGKGCLADGLFYYLTSVVFDRNGMLISKYRKSNVNEYGKYDVPKLPEIVTFTTDFGVTFSHIICFDILFKKPWINIARELNVTDFIYHMASFTALPFRGPIQVQAGWSYVENVNLLASGYNWINETYTGSGIYAGRKGILTATIALAAHEELLVADVPKKMKNNVTNSSITHDRPNEAYLDIPKQYQGYQIFRESFLKNNRSFVDVKIDSFDGFQTKFIARNGSVSEEFSHNELRCKFEVDVTNLGPYVSYRLVAFDGLFPYGELVSLRVKICSVVFCTNFTLESCGRNHDSSTTFQSVRVTAIHMDKENTIMAPNSLGTDMFPLRNWLFDQREQQEHVHTTVFLPKPTRNLISFGMWGRTYDKDQYNFGLGN